MTGKSTLQIEAVILSAAPLQPIRAEAFLPDLSDLDWAELRANATSTGKSDTPHVRCADCGHAVYARESSSGRRHFYHFGTAPLNCRWSDARARNFRSIDAEKFGGRQESELHKSLKRMIVEILSFDELAVASCIAEERFTKGCDGSYAYPDVYCENWQGSPTAFEVQLSTTQLPTILRRERFYADNGIRLCWIVGDETGRLEQRAFKDIHLRNDGQILGIDGDVLSAARKVGKPKFRLYRLLPGPAYELFSPRWRNKIVDPSNVNWTHTGGHPRSDNYSFDEYLSEQILRNSALGNAQENFYKALSLGDTEAASKIWSTVAGEVGGLEWDELGQSYDTMRSLGVLSSIRLRRVNVPTKIAYHDLPHLVSTMLLEPKNRRKWTAAFVALAKKVKPELLEHPTIIKKCERNFAEIIEGMSIDQSAGQVFDVFFPEGAFRRLRR